MTENTGRTIVQIMPATGWTAVHELNGQVVVSPLAAWALVEEDGARFVVGVDAALEEGKLNFPDLEMNFKTYAHVDQMESMVRPLVEGNRIKGTLPANWRQAHKSARMMPVIET